MNFALLWLDALLICLLWVAATAACVGRIKRRWVRGLLRPLVIGVPVVPLGTFVFAATVMKFHAKIEPNWFGYTVSLLLAYIVGAFVILRRAARREAELPPAAATWPRALLGLACVMAIVVGYMTLLNMDLAIRARCAIISVEVNSIYLATLPAITSDSQNAAPLYEKAFARLQLDQAEEELINNPPTGNGDTFDSAEPATIKFLNDESATIALLRRAAALPACRFDEDVLDPDIDSLLPFLNEERNAANILRLDAKEQIAHGNAAAAIADSMAILQMSRHFGQRPLLLSALVGIGIDAVGDETLQESLTVVKNQNELTALRLEELPSMGRMFQQALRGEERFGLRRIGSLRVSDLKASATRIEGTLMDPGLGLGSPYVSAFILDPDAYIQLMQDLQDAATKPYYTVQSDVSQVFGLQHRGIMMSILAPSLARSFQTCAHVEASDACAQVGVAMTRYRLDHGKLPDHLADLAPTYLDAVPIDPFDGHPLRLAIKGDQRIIYSIGPDAIDDGGVEISHGKGDVTFTIKFSPKEAATKP